MLAFPKFSYSSFVFKFCFLLNYKVTVRAQKLLHISSHTDQWDHGYSNC